MRLLLACGIANACLYATLLPLWEGFDEPFHYGYVEELARHARLPVLGRTTLTAEIAQSLPLAPASHIVKHNISTVPAFDEFFSQPQSRRDELRARLARLDPRSAYTPSEMANYEAHQAPLAYLLMAPLDWALRNASLLARVLWLRLACSLFSVAATAALAFSLARQTNLDREWAHSIVFLAIASQMFYATVAHVANDWLVVPLFLLLVRSGIAMRQAPTRRAVAIFCCVFAAGLLTKASFLALLPFFAWECLKVRRVAMPLLSLGAAGCWYVRNLLLYGELSGMQETARRGAPLFSMLRNLTRFPWLKSLYATAMTSLWTGNNSDTRFNQKALAVILLLMAVAGVSYIRTLRRSKATVAETVTTCALASYLAGLLYSTLLSYTVTRGAQIFPSPWYTQPLFVPACCLLMLGLARIGRYGVLLRHALVAVFAYVMCATWVAKLIPLYGGFPGEHARVGALLDWYARSFGAISRTLSTTAMAPAFVIWALVAIAVPLTVAAAVAATRVSVH